ncbi:MAG: phosphatase PAP2 family protein [Sphingomonas sp.]
MNLLAFVGRIFGVVGGIIFDRLRRGIPDEELQSGFEPLSVPSVVVVVVGYTTIGATLLFTDFSLKLTLPWQLWASLAVFPLIGVIARRYLLRPASDILQATSILAMLSFLAHIGSILITPLTLQYVDEYLVSFDMALRVPWLDLFRFMQSHGDMLDLNRQFYGWLMVQPPLVVVLLVLLRQRRRLWIFVNAWAITLALTLAIYVFAPAKGPFWYYSIAGNALPGLTSHLPWIFPQVLDQLRDGSLRDITKVLGVGLVSFPSFHAAGAALLAWAMWGNRFTRFPFLLFNSAVTGSALISGGHYVIDIVGGWGVAAVSIPLAWAFMFPDEIRRRFLSNAKTNRLAKRH